MTQYRILVTGSRDWDDRRTVWQAIASTVMASAPSTATIVVVHGDCPDGADAHAAAWAAAAQGDNRRPVIEEGHPADWRPGGVFDRAAGFRRNAEMVNAGADACLAFLAPCSKPSCTELKPHPSHGTAHCAELAEQAGIPTRRYTA
ncbi:SLOG family protein [Streptomyces aureus]|uniref:SLOG family protein n=1 Tax=Streptomyces aureus TaxID=193461 RepID=UPI0005658CAE|nr:SLOG family protein [Streptomyces aureus]